MPYLSIASVFLELKIFFLAAYVVFMMQHVDRHQRISDQITWQR